MIMDTLRPPSYINKSKSSSAAVKHVSNRNPNPFPISALVEHACLPRTEFVAEWRFARGFF